MPQSDEAQSDKSQTNNKKQRRSRAWLWWVLGGLVVATGLGVASYYLKDGAERAKFLADSILSALVLVAVIVQALIYNQQRRIMASQIEHARISERAYIGIKQISIENFIIGAAPVVRLTFINGGRTPAYKLKTPGHMTITKAGLPFPDERPEGSPRASETFLAAGSFITSNYPFVIPWTDQWASAIEKGEYFIFLHVEAQFDDAWGVSHVMPFKFEYGPNTQRWHEYKDAKYTKPIVEIS